MGKTQARRHNHRRGESFFDEVEGEIPELEFPGGT